MPTFTFEEASQGRASFTFEEAQAESEAEARIDVERRIAAEEEGTSAQLATLSTTGPIVPVGAKREALEPDLEAALEPIVTLPRAEPVPGGFPGQQPSTAEKVAAGAYNVAAGAVESLTSPASIATLGIAAAVRPLTKVMTAAWTALMAKDIPKRVEDVNVALKNGDAQQVTEAVGNLAVATGFTAIGARETVRRAPVEVQQVAEAKAPQTAAALAETLAIEKAAAPETAKPLPEQVIPERPVSTPETRTEKREALSEPEAELRAELEGMGFSVREGEAGRQVTEQKPAEIVGMGGATPAEFAPARQTATGIKNAKVDQERQVRGQEPILAPARLGNEIVWDRAMAKIDTDPAWQDRLISELQEKPRNVSAEEIVALDQRYADLHNEYAKATRDGARHYADGYNEGVLEASERAAFYESKLSELEQVARNVGTEWGRSGQMRNRLLKEDYSLAAMERKLRAAKGFEPLTEQEHAKVNELSEAIQQAENAAEVSEAKTPRARTGGLGGKAARDRGKVDVLKSKFDRTLADTAYKRLPHLDKAWTGTKETLNLARSILTSWDLSAVRRQGGFIGAGNPVRAFRNLGPMFKALASEERAAAIEAEIRSRPNAALYEQSKLYLAPRESAKLSKLEENFMSRLANRIPGVGASQRAYVTFLNKMRADTFDALLAQRQNPSWFAKNVFGLKTDPVTAIEAKALANYINVATGRGTLPKVAEAGAELLATGFFAPRWVVSRFQLLGGQPFYHGSMATRYLIAREYAKYLTGMATIYGLGLLAGGDIEDDPRSSDFGKLRFGNTRLDVMSGLSQTTVLLSRLASGETKNFRGNILPLRGKVPYGARTSYKAITDFLRTKFAPVPGAAIDIVTGKDVIGREVTPGGVAANLVVPMTFGDIYDVMVEQGVPSGTAMAILAIFGDNVQTYQQRNPAKER